MKYMFDFDSVIFLEREPTLSTRLILALIYIQKNNDNIVNLRNDTQNLSKIHNNI